MKTFEGLMTTLLTDAREELKKGLAHLTEAQNRIFKLMYAPFLKGITLKERIDRYSIDEIVDMIHDDELARAMQQVQRTLDKEK